MLCGRWTMTESRDIYPAPAFTFVPSEIIHWQHCQDGNIPSGAVIGGQSQTGETLYVGRARLRENRDELTTGMVIPSEKCLLLSYGTGVRRSTAYEILVTSTKNALAWVPCKEGHVAPNSVIGGIDCSYLEPLYVGRTRGPLDGGRTWRGQRLKDLFSSQSGLENNVTAQLPGKIHRTHRCLYVPFADKEFLFREYEVLVIRSSPASLIDMCKAVIRRTILDKYSTAIDIDKDPSVVDEILNQALEPLPLPKKLKSFCISSLT